MATNTIGPGLGPGILRHPRWRIARYSLMLLVLFGGTLLAWPGLLKNLFAEAYLPHGFCLSWEPALVWLHVGSDTLIGISYVSISLTLAWLVKRARRDIPFQWIFLAFGLFIIACGATHLMEVVTLWRPLYWLAGDFKLITAIASVATAIVLPPLVPKTLRMIDAAKESENRRLRIEQANRELEAATSRLREVDQLKTQFFANISHELRTPLTLTLGHTEKLLASGDLPEGQRRDLEVIHRHSRALLKHVNDLLDLSKLDAGKMQLSLSAVDVAEVAKRVATNFETVAQQRQIEFTRTQPESLMAEVDEEKVERILLNLLSNAFKFTPNGGKVRFELANAFGNLSFVVSDSGPGVPAEMREVVFERFRQADEGATRKFGGTGLGLAIVKDLAQLHGGNVRVDEAAEGGARFKVEIPFRAPALTIATEQEHPKEPSKVVTEATLDELKQRQPSAEVVAEVQSVEDAMANAPLVLVVEDNDDMNRFIVESLAGSYRFASASDGAAGLQKAIELRPDVIVSDVMMPTMSGVQLVEAMRKQPELDATPIILVTARVDLNARVEALRLGAQDYIMKPFSAEELRIRVRNLISMSRARHILQQELETQSHDVQELANEVAFRKRQLQSTFEALRKSEARYRRLVESNIVGVLVANFDGRVLDTNDAFLNMLGYARADFTTGRVLWSAITPVEYRATDQRAVKQLRETGVAAPWEKEYIRKDGSRVPVLLGCAMVDGSTDTALVIVIDLTERKRMEAALREGEQRFRALVEGIPQLVWSSGADGVYDFVNQRWQEYTGLTAEESLGRGWQRALHQDDYKTCVDAWSRLTHDSRSYVVEYRLRRHDGVYRWFLVRAFPVVDAQGRVVQWFGTCTDIDDQKRAEQASQELAAIVENSEDAIIAVRPDLKIAAWNNGAESVYGYRPDEMLGRPITLLAAGGATEWADLIARIMKGEKVRHFQTRRVRKDGRLIDVSLTVSPIRDSAGNITGASTIARDITEMKRAETALRAAEKLATIGRLTATIAHEINNPLEAVSNVLYLLQNTPGMKEEAHHYLDIAQQEMNRIAHIVKQTLGFHRESPAPVPIDMKTLVDSVIDLHRHKMERAGVSLEKRYELAGVVPGFPGEMRQVFSNLIGNALDALSRGGKVIVRVRATRDYQSGDRCGVRVTVADNGSGISRENRSRLFEPFFTTKGEKGTGLGLWVSQGIVSKHHGYIRVRSCTIPGHSGTVFSVFLPSGSLLHASERESAFAATDNGEPWS